VSGGDSVLNEELGAKCLFRSMAMGTQTARARVALMMWSNRPIAKGLERQARLL
jgi:hypothetical protein